MAEITAHSPGRFCWADLGTNDLDGAKKLYGELFNWQFRDVPVGEGMGYTMALVRGHEVAGLYRLDEKEKAAGWLPRWQAYISVANADAAAGRVKELGGKVIAPPVDVQDAGRMAVVQDPVDAIIALWEPRAHIGARLMGEPGSICWNELLTRDIDKAASFYMKLFPWEPRTMETGAGPYTIFNFAGVDEAGMMLMPPECGHEIPCNWLVYFMVEDCDATVAKAEKLSARIMKSPTDIPWVGRFAVLQDTQGAVFAVFKPSPRSPAETPQ
ncbi:MAG: VOC family protein [Geobacter sp.]|nr:MAG: VOC family protein [Geobacter sp.]